MEPGEGATLAWMADIRISGGRGQPLGLVWEGPAWGMALLLISCPPLTSPFSFCREKALGSRIQETLPAPKHPLTSNSSKGQSPRLQRGHVCLHPPSVLSPGACCRVLALQQESLTQALPCAPSRPLVNSPDRY